MRDKHAYSCMDLKIKESIRGSWGGQESCNKREQEKKEGQESKKQK